MLSFKVTLTSSVLAGNEPESPVNCKFNQTFSTIVHCSGRVKRVTRKFCGRKHQWSRSLNLFGLAIKIRNMICEDNVIRKPKGTLTIMRTG